MNEEYEYERVEITPGMVGQIVYTDKDNYPFRVVDIGYHVWLEKAKGGDWPSYCVGGPSRYSPKYSQFYIRKPRRKMVKKALSLFKTTYADGRVDYFPSTILLTEEEARKSFGFYRWPYGQVVDVEEGL